VALVGIGLIVSPYWKRVSWRGNPVLPTGVTEDGSHFIGAEHPEVELHEYVDYFCPHCRIMSRWTEKQLILHPDKLRIVRRFHPASSCPSYKLRQCLYVAAALCAAEQGKFWQMDRWLLENSAQRARLELAAGARAIGADAAALRACVDRAETLDRVRELAREAGKMKFAGTPGYVLDGKRVAPRHLEARLKERLR
jgi:protein-disulfide isomerase